MQVHPPEDSSKPFFNRKGSKSLNMMIVANAEYQIYYVSTGTPGHGHDSMIFRQSGLYHMLDSGRYKPSPRSSMLVADSAYEVKTFI